MLRKTLILAFCLVFILASSLVAVEKLTPSKVSSEQPVMPPLITAGCIMAHTNGVIGSYFGSFTSGNAIISYFDPATCPAIPTYPFEIRSITFPLYNDGSTSYPVQVDFVVYDMTNPPDPCGGPGIEICRETFSCDSTFEYLGVYGMNSLTFSNPCCVNGPVYIGLEYSDPGGGPFPSILFDSQAPPDTCINWFNYGGNWYDWHTIWTPPIPGYPIFWVNGNTPANNCPDQPFPNHKMHFPQYPDLIGWDVNTTTPVPLKLADDWQCSQTGPLLDIHFWGSWKDADGIPETDDIDPGGVNAFIFEIYSNDPGPPSKPGVLLWYLTEFVEGTPTEPPTLEHWYDPLLVMNWPNDHVPYWQYDFVNIPGEPFMQEEGNIYWLAITPILDDPVNFHWGWKTSRDHFMDDAVWWTGETWEPLIEPPRVNNFGVMFNEYGEPIDEGSTNYYGIGWYYYPEYYWWNMWFYDNPYNQNPKHINISFDVMPSGGGTPYIEFALNWSTDLWSLEGVPDRPPLPWDGNEDYFIGRQIFPVDTIGHFDITYTLPYNPEWVSIDFIAGNVIIYNGTIEHECVPTSMDLAFVITGEEEPDIPTLNEWGMIILVLLLLAAGTIAIVRRRRAVASKV